MKKIKKIKIIHTQPNYWYHCLKGCIFDVIRETKQDYYVTIGSVDNEFYINKKDIEIIKQISPTYADKQARWIKENNLKIGDKVKIIYTYKPYQNGFEYLNIAYNPNTIHIIKLITKNYIKLNDIPYPVPYFILESFKEEY